MTPRQEAMIKQLDAQIVHTDKEIKKLEKVKANLLSRKNTITQKGNR